MGTSVFRQKKHVLLSRVTRKLNQGNQKLPIHISSTLHIVSWNQSGTDDMRTLNSPCQSPSSCFLSTALRLRLNSACLIPCVFLPLVTSCHLLTAPSMHHFPIPPPPLFAPFLPFPLKFYLGLKATDLPQEASFRLSHRGAHSVFSSTLLRSHVGFWVPSLSMDS